MCDKSSHRESQNIPTTDQEQIKPKINHNNHLDVLQMT